MSIIQKIAIVKEKVRRIGDVNVESRSIVKWIRDKDVKISDKRVQFRQKISKMKNTSIIVSGLKVTFLSSESFYTSEKFL